MLSEKLQLDPNLMLETTITAAHHREQVRKQQQVIRADETSSNIDTIATKKPQATKAKPTRGSAQQPQKFNPVSNPQVCGRCGKSGHVGKQQCPAKEASYVLEVSQTWLFLEHMPDQVSKSCV